MMNERMIQIVPWRDMLIALDAAGNLWRLRVDPVTGKATATHIPLTVLNETKE